MITSVFKVCSREFRLLEKSVHIKYKNTSICYAYCHSSICMAKWDLDKLLIHSSLFCHYVYHSPIKKIEMDLCCSRSGIGLNDPKKDGRHWRNKKKEEKKEQYNVVKCHSTNKCFFCCCHSLGFISYPNPLNSWETYNCQHWV